MSDQPQARLVMTGLRKSFGGVHALRGVDVDVRPGEVHALVGENGAGKSTLLKILSGAYTPDAGQLAIDGTPVRFTSPRAAHAAGVRVIYQELEIIPHVSVAENIYVGTLPSRRHTYHRRGVEARARADIARYGFAHALAPETLGEQLSPAQRQLVEIMRALIADVRVIAFDEPTSSLSDTEVEALFTLIRRLRDDGVAVLYVSHRLPEIFTIADRVTVLRDGAVVGTRTTVDTSPDTLVSMMVGRDLSGTYSRDAHTPGDVVLSVRGLRTEKVHDVSFDIRAGEVVGIAGLVGAGRSELAHAIVGDDRRTAGEIAVAGRTVRIRGPRDAIRAGIGFVPEERKAQALLMERSVRDNMSLAVLGRISRMHVVRRGEERRIADEFARRLNVRAPSVEHVVANLSGGNQQKVVLARWLASRPRVLILDEPTRGVDVGAKAEIYDAIDGLAADGLAIVVISSELPEILALSDRVLVMQTGRIAGELSRDDASEERILQLAMADQLTAVAAAGKGDEG
ncbi:MAG TPA: sugar ABC transporter ATP-binding protein [Pseudonocardiaceae bacterium]|nr:sugar ABC transporter ATP-binding protein [Pseudonocardiaceae bacterium]